MKPRRRSWWSSASLLALLAVAPVAALSRPLTDQTAGSLVEALLVVSINGTSGGEPVTLLRGPGSSFYAPLSVITACRLTEAATPAFRLGGVEYYLLNAVPGLKLEFEDAEQTLAITARPELLQQTRLSQASLASTDDIVGGKGGFLNYDLTAQLAKGVRSIGGAFEGGIFSKLGVGTTGFVGNWGEGVARLTRLATNWTIDDPARMRSVRLGDSVSRGGAGGAPLRFGGIQFARNFTVQPGFVTIPLPSVQGSAALPSVVDIFVNGTLAGRRDLPAGPFQITDVPIITGSGDVQLVVRDLLGRETLFSQAYYAPTTLLQKGLHDYSYEAGLLRRSFGQESNDYGPMMVSASHRYGFSDSVTAELHGEATREVQVAGAAIHMIVGRLGHVEAAIASSRSDDGQGGWGRLAFERRTRGLSFGASAELSSADYRSIDRLLGRRAPVSVVQAFGAVPLGSGSLSLSYLRRDARGEPDAEYASASTSFRLGNRASLQFAARKSLSGREDLSARVSLILASHSRVSTSAGLSLADGKFNRTAAIEKYRPVGEGLGYRLATSAGAINRVDGFLSANSRFGTHDAQLSWSGGEAGVGMSSAGGIGMIGTSAFASRPLRQSFAKVKVGDYANVRVYADNQLVGLTAADGTLVLPRLRPFDRNSVRIELADLPWDAEVSGDERSIRPFDRHGVLVDFRARPAHAALIRVLLTNGAFLPAGSLLRLNGGSTDFISAPQGEVYLTGVQRRNRAVASWSSGSCVLTFDFVATSDPQPRLGDAICAMIQ